MAFFKIQVKRESNTPKHFNVVANRPQDALQAAASQLREEGITDARSTAGGSGGMSPVGAGNSKGFLGGLFDFFSGKK